LGGLNNTNWYDFGGLQVCAEARVSEWKPPALDRATHQGQFAVHSYTCVSRLREARREPQQDFQCNTGTVLESFGNSWIPSCQYTPSCWKRCATYQRPVEYIF